MVQPKDEVNMTFLIACECLCLLLMLQVECGLIVGNVYVSVFVCVCASACVLNGCNKEGDY